MTRQQRRTETATKLMAQAYVLRRMGTAGLKAEDLATLLTDAAKQLDPMVGLIESRLPAPARAEG